MGEESVAEIQEHADFDRAAAISVAIDIGTPIKIMDNNDPDMETTIREVTRILRQDIDTDPPIP